MGGSDRSVWPTLFVGLALVRTLGATHGQNRVCVKCNATTSSSVPKRRALGQVQLSLGPALRATARRNRLWQADYSGGFSDRSGFMWSHGCASDVHTSTCGLNQLGSSRLAVLIATK